MFPFTIRQLELFSSLSRTQNFQQTAEAFGISQPCVSNQISALEYQLGIQLFNRARGRAPTLTHAGLQFKGEVEEFLAMGGKLARRKVTAPAVVRHLSVYIGGHIFNDFIKTALTDFYAANPNLILNVAHERPRPQVLLDMERGKFDIAVFNHPEKLHLPGVEHIGHVRAGVFAHPSLGYASNDIDVISNLPFLSLPAGSYEESCVAQLLATEGIVPGNAIIRVPDHDVARGRIRENACAVYSIESIFRVENEAAPMMVYRMADWTCHFFARKDVPDDIVEMFRTFIMSCLPQRSAY